MAFIPSLPSRFSPRYHLSDPLTKDYLYCRDLILKNSDHFPVGSLFAPKRMRRHLHAIYAFARTADNFADEAHRTPEEKEALLEDWQKKLHRTKNGTPEDHPIFRALAHTLKETKLPVIFLQNLLTAFRLDVHYKAYETWEELENYCRYSAHPVGRLVLHLAGEVSYTNDPERNDDKSLRSDAFCSALQMTDHWCDLFEDLARGHSCYVPKEIMDRFNVSLKILHAKQFTPEIGALMLFLVQETEKLFLTAEPLLKQIKIPLRLELSIAWEAGMALLEKIRSQEGNIVHHKASLTTLEKWHCLGRAIRSL
ncbi:squalene synthase HpnC [Magnetococcales bacterium HHB-1]